MRKLKILVIKFKYLGDVAVSIPALRALRERYPHAELHFLVAEDAAPIVKHIPWIDHTWAFPRKRGKMQLTQSLPMVMALKREQFDLSIDLVGNDRGALLSYIIGAEERLGPRIHPPIEAQGHSRQKWASRGKGFIGREHCYTRTREEAPVIEAFAELQSEAILDKAGPGRESWKRKPITNIGASRESRERGLIRPKWTSAEVSNVHESLRNLDLLKAIGIEPPENLSPELHADPSLKDYAKEHIPQKTLLCHLSTSMPKKEWPLEQWVAFFQISPDHAERVIFITGPSQREKDRLEAIKEALPEARFLENIPDLRHLMALINEAEALICGDTAPAHLAAGLGTPYVAIFGPSTAQQWDPMGKRTLLIAQSCDCWGHPRSCLRKRPCLADISAQSVYDALKQLLSHG